MTSETADSKIRELCQTLENEALAPAQAQAVLILEQARSEADALVKKTRAEADALIELMRQQMQRERALFDASLRQAAVLAQQSLRNAFEEKLFQPQVAELLDQSLADPVVLTRLIRAVIDAIEREGLGVDLSVEVSKAIDLSALNTLLGQSVLKKLRGGTCLFSDISSGARIGVRDRGLTIDLSDQFLREILEKNLQSSFAKTYFQNP